jgi:hypothetical protein
VNALEILSFGSQTHGRLIGNHEYEATNGSSYWMNSLPGILFLEATRIAHLIAFLVLLRHISH